MKIAEFTPGDTVVLQTKHKEWTGHILESSDPDVILLKLDSGYNIGLKEGDILKAKLLQKAKPQEKRPVQHTTKKSLPNIAMIITGGTISSRLDPKTGGAIPTDAEEILHIAPEIRNIANITTIEAPFMKLSEEMDPDDWKIIAQTATELLNNKDIDGLIITHGTDTLSYTGAALSFRPQ